MNLQWVLLLTFIFSVMSSHRPRSVMNALHAGKRLQDSANAPKPVDLRILNVPTDRGNETLTFKFANEAKFEQFLRDTTAMGVRIPGTDIVHTSLHSVDPTVSHSLYRLWRLDAVFERNLFDFCGKAVFHAVVTVLVMSLFKFLGKLFALL